MHKFGDMKLFNNRSTITQPYKCVPNALKKLVGNIKVRFHTKIYCTKYILLSSNTLKNIFNSFNRKLLNSYIDYCVIEQIYLQM